MLLEACIDLSSATGNLMMEPLAAAWHGLRDQCWGAGGWGAEERERKRERGMGRKRVDAG